MGFIWERIWDIWNIPSPREFDVTDGFDVTEWIWRDRTVFTWPRGYGAFNSIISTRHGSNELCIENYRCVTVYLKLVLIYVSPGMTSDVPDSIPVSLLDHIWLMSTHYITTPCSVLIRAPSASRSFPHLRCRIVVLCFGKTWQKLCLMNQFLCNLDLIRDVETICRVHTNDNGPIISDNSWRMMTAECSFRWRCGSMSDRSCGKLWRGKRQVDDLCRTNCLQACRRRGCGSSTIFSKSLLINSLYEIVYMHASRVTSNFGPPQDLKNGPPIPQLALYGLKMGPFGSLLAWAPRSCGPCGPIVIPLMHAL